MNALKLLALVALLPAASFAADFNGLPDNERDDLGYYYVLTGGQFPNGQTYNGDNASGGTLRYLVDDPSYAAPLGTWQKDDWFTQNSGLALTLKNAGNIVYDNNGIETHTTNGFYHESTNANLAGLYRGYSMSNNYDWIYSGYFKLTEDTTIDTLIGYFDARSMPNPSNPELAFRMNIWSSIVSGSGLIPAVNSFTGDVLSSDSTLGTFSWSDTGEDRYLSAWAAPHTGDILRLQFVLDTPITLSAGEYFFSHDAIVVPEPASIALIALGGIALIRRHRK